MPEPGDLPLADFISALRDQIRAARDDADPDLQIVLGPVTVEFTLLTRREAEGRAGITFWVVDAGASGKAAGESTQKVTIELHPMQPGGAERAGIGEAEAQGAGEAAPASWIADTDEADPELSDFSSDPRDY